METGRYSTPQSSENCQKREERMKFRMKGEKGKKRKIRKSLLKKDERRCTEKGWKKDGKVCICGQRSRCQGLSSSLSPQRRTDLQLRLELNVTTVRTHSSMVPAWLLGRPIWTMSSLYLASCNHTSSSHVFAKPI